MKELIEAIPIAAKSPLALVAYLAALLAWVAIALRTKRINAIMRHLQIIPERDRRSLLETEMGIKLPKEVPPDAWLKARRQTYLFWFLIVLVLAVLAVVAIATFIVEPSPKLAVAFAASPVFATAEISNIGQSGIIKARSISLETSSNACPYLIPPPVAAPMIEYRYHKRISTKQSNYLLDTRDFKYGPGDIDRFFVDMRFEENAIYEIGLGFDYQLVGVSSKWNKYQSEKDCVAICYDGSLPEPESRRPMGGLPQCDSLGFFAFEYIQDLLESPPVYMSRQDLLAFINRYPCQEIREQYIKEITRQMNDLKSSQKDISARIAKTLPCPAGSGK
jgi:hypothetical protein